MEKIIRGLICRDRQTKKQQLKTKSLKLKLTNTVYFSLAIF